jgi:hypothetical protein
VAGAEQQKVGTFRIYNEKEALDDKFYSGRAV